MGAFRAGAGKAPVLHWSRPWATCTQVIFRFWNAHENARADVTLFLHPNNHPLDSDLVEVGDEVVLFGDPRTGASSVDDFAAACSTINYEIVTRMGGRFKRVYVGGE